MWRRQQFDRAAVQLLQIFQSTRSLLSLEMLFQLGSQVAALIKPLAIHLIGEGQIVDLEIFLARFTLGTEGCVFLTQPG